jgi:hypothetical protein
MASWMTCRRGRRDCYNLTRGAAARQPMKFLDRFERLVERGVEGGLGRILPRSLQPVQIAKAAARAMDDGRVVGVRGPEVPNLYRVRLAPADLGRFGDFRGTLAANTAAYLAEYARQRGLRPVSQPSVELVEDRSVPQGSVRVDARFRDATGFVPRSASDRGSSTPAPPRLAAPSSGPPVAGASPPSNAHAPAAVGPARDPAAAWPTGSPRLAPLGGPAPGSAPPSDSRQADASSSPSESGPLSVASALVPHEQPAEAAASSRSSSPANTPSTALGDRGWLVDRAGRRYTLRDREILRLGRAADNDVILDADTVSRHHAELRWQAGQWFVYDLGSTNGTTVAGAPVGADPILLPAGATLRLGDRALTFVTS